MRIFGVGLVLWPFAVCSAAAQETSLITGTHSINDDETLLTLENRSGWVNPEDLISMPQCIAQQDPYVWLNVMNKCTRKTCTRHFGIICTHHQWLTQLNCLSIEFSPDIVKLYLPYCSRSVLAKAQLFQWIRSITGRAWLVNVGDANGLQALSPASLTQGYATVDIAEKAPICLKESLSASSMESFGYVMASCGFTANTQHTGNAARPWEYNESLRSMTALDSETAAYELTQRHIEDVNYFDRRCFCQSFITDQHAEPCAESALVSTMERLWLRATCGPTSLPLNWTDGLKTTDYAYIPTENWQWPDCVPSIPEKVLALPSQCMTNACEIDASGYCKIKSAVDRSCVCRSISYSACKGSCHIFETRINYIKWLHDLCGGEQGWHGLPTHWQHLTVITPIDMIPWRWCVKPHKSTDAMSLDHLESLESSQIRISTDWRLISLVLINLTPFLTRFIETKTGICSIVRDFFYPSGSWFLTGLTIATLHIVANLINAILVQSALGYEKVPVIQLMLLWCCIPRITWSAILMVSFRPYKVTCLYVASSCLFSEIIVQVLAGFYMIKTVSYGLKHGFYNQGMARLETWSYAQLMYAGASMWLGVMVMATITIVCIVIGFDKTTKERISNGSASSEKTPLMSSQPDTNLVYGTLPVSSTNNTIIENSTMRLFPITIISVFLLWVAQWLFWIGFIKHSLEEFCLPNLGVLTVVWASFSLGVGIITMPLE